MKKVSLIAFASIVLTVMYWIEFAVCYTKSKEIDGIKENVLGFGETSKFTDHLTYFTSVGLLMPSLLIFSVVISFVHKVDPDDLDNYITAVPVIGYIAIVIISLGSMIYMVPYLFLDTQSRYEI